MPVEIMELVVKATVSESGATTQSNNNTSDSQIDRAALEPVEKAVKEIMDILKRKNER